MYTGSLTIYWFNLFPSTEEQQEPQISFHKRRQSNDHHQSMLQHTNGKKKQSNKNTSPNQTLTQNLCTIGVLLWVPVGDIETPSS